MMADTNAAAGENAEKRSIWPGLGRVIDYSFGRNALIGMASLMLLVISGYATWSGMNDFIVGVSTSPGVQGREIVGGLSVSNELLVIAIVVALTFLMWLALRETFATGRRLTDRLVTFPLYLFLALWSIGFGYGFWWSLIAGEEATKKGLAGLQEDARDAGQIVAARLEAVKIQLDSVVQWSDGQMSREETSGGSCGVASGAGRGPLYNARRSVRDSVTSLRDSITKAWLEPVRKDLETLRQSASALTGTTVAERQQNFEAMARAIRGSARNIAARSNQLGQSTAAEMRALAAAVSIKPREQGFACYDPTLAQRLRQAAEQAAAPAVLNLRAAAFSEGPAGVANAVKNLWSNMGSYITSLPRYVYSGGKATAAVTSEGEPITGRDLIALLATLGIDLGLFALTVLNPPRTPPNWRLPEAVGRQIRDAIQTALARAPDTNLEWIRRHFLHHVGASYFVIPNVYSSDRGRPGEQERALAMNQLAGILQDLGMIKVLSASQLRSLGRDEARDSLTDLTGYREKWHTKRSSRSGAAPDDPRKPTRNHGLFSKAERALEICGWSRMAMSDIEVFGVVDRDGLTPLLAVLNDPKSAIETPLVAGKTDRPVLAFDDMRSRYIAALTKDIELPEKAEAVVLKIATSQNDIDTAIEALLGSWPTIAAHLAQVRRQVARSVLVSSETQTAAWIRDDAMTYPISTLPTADLQLAVVTYKILDVIADDVARHLPAGGDAGAAPSTRLGALASGVKKIKEFLQPGASVDVRTLIDGLESVRQQGGSNGVTGYIEA